MQLSIYYSVDRVHDIYITRSIKLYSYVYVISHTSFRYVQVMCGHLNHLKRNPGMTRCKLQKFAF